MNKNIYVFLTAIGLLVFSLTGLGASPIEKRLNPDLQKESSAVMKVATFAGGCFWCMEPPFEKLQGVKQVIPGYTGGTTQNPTYNDVSYGSTGHVEAVQIHYDATQVSYEDLLEVFWRNVDPTDNGGQFVDRGDSYLTAIYYHGAEQKKQAQESKSVLKQVSVML